MFGRFVRPVASTMLAMTMISGSISICRAQSHDDHHPGTMQQTMTAQDNLLVQKVREATIRFKDVTSITGPGNGYGLAFGCVSGGDFGAMGLHYVNMALVEDGEVNENFPEIILFEPAKNGTIKITGADFLVYADTWKAIHGENAAPPMLRGQLFHYFESPNRFGLPAFYTLHVWAWKDNPNGTFVNWNPDVACDGFSQ